MADTVRRVDSRVSNLPMGVLSSYTAGVYQFGSEIICDSKYKSTGIHET